MAFIWHPYFFGNIFISLKIFKCGIYNRYLGIGYTHRSLTLSVQKSAIEPKMPPAAYPNVGHKHSHTIVGMTTFFYFCHFIVGIGGVKLLAP
jgi:hypothetical protein